MLKGSHVLSFSSKSLIIAKGKREEEITYMLYFKMKVKSLNLINLEEKYPTRLMDSRGVSRKLERKSYVKGLIVST